VFSSLAPYAEEIIGDHQCGFRCKRSTTDHIFCICQILEKKWEYNTAVCQLFIDFKKAYDTVRTEVLYNILVHPRTGHEGSEGSRGVWSMSRPSYINPRKEIWYSFYRKLSGFQGRSGWVRKILPPNGIQSPDHPVHSQSLYQSKWH
jgi:hypothetical protein